MSTFLEGRRGPAAAAMAGALFALLLGVLADGYARHGVRATWWQRGPDGQRVEVARTVEHRTTFPNQHRPLARYLQHWPFDRLPIPERLPALDAELAATLHVPTGRGPVVVVAQSPNATQVRVDGRPVPPTGIGPGWHRLDVTWQGDFRRPTALTLAWGPPQAEPTPIPREQLVPLGGSGTPLRWAAWFGAAALAALLATLLWRVAVVEGTARLERVATLATVCILLLGTAYRTFDYDVMPEYRENGDELFAMWNGFSIVDEGRTRGWSLWSGVYEGVAEVERIQQFDQEWFVVSPYFEHPPAFHVLTGLACKLGGATDWQHVRLRHGRLVPIALSALTMLLLVLVGRRLDPDSPAPFLAALLYAAIPMIAVQSRVIKEEALVAPMALATTWLFLRWRDSGRARRDLVLAAACAGLSTLAKVTGFALVPALVMLVAAERDRRAALLAAGVGVGTASLFLVFGAGIDWHAFAVAMAHQNTRPIHFNIFLRWFDDGLINTSVVGRGWVLFLWIGTLGTVFARPARDTAVLTVPLVLYICAISIGSGNWTYGWYALPFYPFLCIGAGRFLTDLWRKPDLMRGAMFTLVCVLYSLNFTLEVAWMKQPESWPVMRRVVPLVVAGLLTPYALAQVWPVALWQRLSRASLALGLAAVVALGGVFVARYDLYYDTYRNFDRDAFFDR